jgi:RimJ/RimL family protein N-acetyltransferase
MRKVLRTPRLHLRAPQPGDEHAAHANWARDGEVLAWLGWRPRSELAQTRAQLDWDQARWLKRSAFTWMLVEPAGTQGAAPVGMVQLVAQRLDAPPHHLRLGFLLARAHWGRGLMREAVAAVAAEAFEQSHVWRIDALCDVDNHASARLLRALGFVHEGILRRHSLHPNVSDEPRDVASYALARP